MRGRIGGCAFWDAIGMGKNDVYQIVGVVRDQVQPD